MMMKKGEQVTPDKAQRERGTLFYGREDGWRSTASSFISPTHTARILLDNTASFLVVQDTLDPLLCLDITNRFMKFLERNSCTFLPDFPVLSC